MKSGIHPTDYRPVVFQDLNDDSTVIVRSTAPAEETITLEGVEYPLIKIHISSSSHPFFTGEERIVDVEGRVDKFKARQAAAVKAREARAAAKPKAKKQREAEATKLGAQAKTEKPGKAVEAKADSEDKPAEQAQE